MARRRAPSPEEAEGNLTAMLDVIFNILAFFVVTFNPPKPEKNFDVSLPPPKPVQAQGAAGDPLPDEDIELFQDVTIRLTANPNGSLASIRVEDNLIEGGIPQLSRRLRDLRLTQGKFSGKGIEAATIIADPGLKYAHVIAVIDACYQANLQKINFAKTGGP